MRAVRRSMDAIFSTREVSVLGPVRAAAAIAVAVLLCIAAPAAADTALFSDSYRAYDPFSAQKDKCSMTMPIDGAEPAGDGTYPVLVFIHGTGSEKGDLATGKAVVHYAAQLGYVAAAPVYK